MLHIKALQRGVPAARPTSTVALASLAPHDPVLTLTVLDQAPMPMIPKIRLMIALLALTGSAAALADNVNRTQLQASDAMQFVPVASAAAYSLYEHDYSGLLQLGEEVSATELLTFGLKVAVNHTSWGRRPDGGDHSFPSGHTALACSGAAYVGERYGWEYSAPLYAVAGYVAYIRVNERRHHPRDVIAGCAAATGLSFPIVNRYVGRDVSLTPAIGAHEYGLNLEMPW